MVNYAPVKIQVKISYSFECSLQTGSLRGQKKIWRAKCESGSEASGSRSMNPRAHTPSSPDRSWLVPLALDYTWLSRPKPNWEPVRQLL